MMGDMGKMLKQMKQMQSQMKAVEKELKTIIVEGQSKNGQVLCRMDGKLNLKELTIAPELVEGKNVKEVEKSCFEAVEKALDLAQKEAQSRLSAGGLNLPGM